MTGARYTLLLVLAMALPAPQAGTNQTSEGPPSRTSGEWALFYSSGTTLSSNALGQPVIRMPTRGSVNMLTRAWSGASIGKTLTVTVHVETVGDPLFHLAQGPEPTCRTPPSTRPYLEANGWTSMPADESYTRWWSRNAFIPLASAQSFSIDVPLRPDRWSGVSGKLATDTQLAARWFERIVTATQAGRIGLVFGGGCSFGHGLYVSGGSATLTVTQFETK